MHAESGEGWSLEQVTAIEAEYRRFLFLMHKYPTEQAAPLMAVDIFWHYHILDTLKYAEDCQSIFGYFLHHFPYIGLRGEADEEAHVRCGNRMKELYEETFGEDYNSSAAIAYSAVAAKTAYSAVAAKTAYSAVASKPVDAQVAYSAVAAKTAYSAVADLAAHKVADFYSVRPRLPN